MQKLKNRMTMAAMLIIAVAMMLVMIAGTDAQGKQAATEPPQTERTSTPAGAVVTTESQAITATTIQYTEQEPETEPETAYTYYDVPLTDELQEYAQDLCTEYTFPYYDIVVAMIATESRFDPDAVSETNDYGLMQINKINHEWLAEEIGAVNMLDEKQNIHSGIYILQGLYHKYDDIGLALMCYNCGESGAKELWQQGVWSTYYSRTIQQEASELTVRAG